MENTVSSLKTLNFHVLPLQRKLEIVRNGRPTPHLNLVGSGISRKKAFTRRFRKTLYDANLWLCGCSALNALFCFPCLLFGGEDKWTKTGVTCLNHLSSKLLRHKHSSTHAHNMISLSLLTSLKSKLLDGASTVISKHNENVKENRSALSKIIDCIIFGGKHHIPVIKNDESKQTGMHGVFCDIIEFVCKFDASLKLQLIRSSAFKNITTTIYDDILKSILEVCRNRIKEEIECCDCVALICNQVVGVHDQSHIIIVLRYMLKGKPVERFWGCYKSKEFTSEAVAAILLHELEYLLGENKHRLIAQCYDGSPACCGLRSNVPDKIKEKYPRAHFLHCYTHDENEIIQQICSQNVSARVFFNNLSAICTFFSYSPQRMAVLDEVVHKRNLRERRKYNLESETVQFVFYLKDALCESCTVLQESASRTTSNGASFIKTLLDNSDFLFWLDIFSNVMPIVRDLIVKMQAEPSLSVTAPSQSSHLTTFNVVIQLLRDALEAETDAGYSCKRKCDESRILDANQVYDLILFHFKKRFEFTAHKQVCALLRSHKNIQKNDCFVPACKSYAVDLDRFCEEFNLLCSRPEIYKGKNLLQLLQTLSNGFLGGEVFPQLTAFLNIVITTPMHTNDPELCFSTVGEIQGFFRTSSAVEQLPTLAMMSIHNEMMSKIGNFNEKVIEHFAAATHCRDFKFK